MNKYRAYRLSDRRIGLNERNHVSPWHNQIHLFQELTLVRALGDQFKFSTGKGGLFHLPITFESRLRMTYDETFAENS